MEVQVKDCIKIINFKRISPPQNIKPQVLAFDSISLNVVLVQIEGSAQERKKLLQCEQWIKTSEHIRLMKINKSDAFQSTYRLMMKQSLPVYFVMMIPIEQLKSQPIYNLYRNEMQQGKSLNEINQLAKDNIGRIKFIIIQDQLQKLNKISFLHGGVHLVTTQAHFVIQILQEHLKRQGRQKNWDSTSSINTVQIQSFAKQMDHKVGQGVNIPQKKNQNVFDPQMEAWKMKNNTPGVGSYNV